jgi:hypothetical protein
VEHAHRTLGLERLICFIMPGNERSVAIARKIGMDFEREYTDEYGLCHIYARSISPGREASPHARSRRLTGSPSRPLRGDGAGDAATLDPAAINVEAILEARRR